MSSYDFASLAEKLGMKTKFKKLSMLSAIFIILNLAFNNCGQPGEIRFNTHASLERNSPGMSNDNSSSATDEGGDSGAILPDQPAPPSEPQSPGVPDPILIQKELNLKVESVEKVDILFVIDNSASMNYEQSNMAERFSRFIHTIRNLDWQIGIITTDVANPDIATSDGKLLKFEGVNTYVLNSSMNTSDVEIAFAKTIQRKEIGSGFEQGIFGTYRFLERDLERERSFLRENSAFSVVIVSDSDETPWNTLNGKPFYELKNQPKELLKFMELRWKEKKYQFHSIIVKNGDKTCLASHKNEAYGDLYASLSALTNGVVGSVCESDYGSQLKFLGEKVNELINSAQLECEPKDFDGDGKIDIEISSDSGALPEIEKIIGKSIYFNKNLLAGNFKIKYYCQ